MHSFLPRLIQLPDKKISIIINENCFVADQDPQCFSSCSYEYPTFLQYTPCLLLETGTRQHEHTESNTSQQHSTSTIHTKTRT
jgi:hypothetical protein